MTIIVKTYNNPDALDAIIAALAQGTRLPDECVVADDGSGAPTRKLIEHWQKKAPFKLVHCWHEDCGFRAAKISNKAVAQSTSDYLVFLDGDCIPEHHFVADHYALAQERRLVQGRRSYIRQNVVRKYLKRELSLLQLTCLGHVGGWWKAVRLPLPIVLTNNKLTGTFACNLGMWKKDFLTVNGYDEAYEGWGIEDSDLVYRLYLLGLKRKFVYCQAIVYHLDHEQRSRDYYDLNKSRLAETMKKRQLRCNAGVDQYL